MPTACGDLRKRRANVPTLYGEPMPEQAPVLVAPQGMAVTLDLVFLGPDHMPVDLNGCLVDLADPPCKMRVTDPLVGNGNVVELDGTVADAATGLLRFELAADQVICPGLYTAEAALFLGPIDPGGAPRMMGSNRLFLARERSLFGSITDIAGPPTLAELRLHLRDSSPAESPLLDTVTFSNAELGAAMRRAVDYWNEALPNIGVRHSVQSFPYRYWWLEATRAELYRILGEWLRRNRLPFQGGGMNVDEVGTKAQEYRQDATETWQRYEAWVRSEKIRINLENCYGSVPGLYGGYTGGYMGGW